MEELKEILDKGQERSLILIDEIASGTNPTEGTALTKSLVDYLIEKPYISLITTHFESVTEREDIVNSRSAGLLTATSRCSTARFSTRTAVTGLILYPNIWTTVCIE